MSTARTARRERRCRSGGDRHVNTGNGCCGGLRSSAGTWRGASGNAPAAAAPSAAVAR
ncbi:transglycosylase family protein [Streptomyces sp. V3I8]|uniref:transglycosylase family protein n=1 Tax=Streptomyces sp. V3I8 TaxID=3042279 RepID=UPI0035943E61